MRMRLFVLLFVFTIPILAQTTSPFVLGTPTQGIIVSGYDCGIIADGTTDNYTALNNCITGSIPKAGIASVPPNGLKIILPPGIIGVSLVGGRTPLTISADNVVLEGSSGFTNTWLCHTGGSTGVCLGSSVIRAIGSGWTGNPILTWDGTSNTRGFVNGGGMNNVDLDGNNLAGEIVKLKYFNGMNFSNFNWHDWTGGLTFGVDIVTTATSVTGTCGNNGGFTLFNNGNIQSYLGGVNGIRLGSTTPVPDVCSIKFNNIFLETTNYAGNHALWNYNSDSNQFTNIEVGSFSGQSVTSITATSATTATLVLSTPHNMSSGVVGDGIWIGTATTGTCPATGAEVVGLNGIHSATYVNATTLTITDAYGLTNGASYCAGLVAGSGIEFGPAGTGRNTGIGIFANTGVHSSGSYVPGTTNLLGVTFDVLDNSYNHMNGFVASMIDGSTWGMIHRDATTYQATNSGNEPIYWQQFLSAPASTGTAIDFTSAVPIGAGYYPMMLYNNTWLGSRGGSGQQTQMIQVNTSNEVVVGGTNTVGVQIPTAAASIGKLRTCTDVSGNFLSCDAGASVSNSTSTSVLSGGAGALLPFDTEQYNIGTVHSTTVNNSRITVQTGQDGIWGCVGQVKFAAVSGFPPSSASYRLASIQKNGTLIGVSKNVPSYDGNDIVQVSVFNNASVGDYFELVAQQDSGSTLTAITGSNSTFFQCKRQ